MTDDANSPELPPEADPMALLAFLQRVLDTVASGGDLEALMAEAPPGFTELFAEAQRRAEAGDVPDIDAVLGMLGGEDEEAEDA
jgi:hypothetical protein